MTKVTGQAAFKREWTRFVLTHKFCTEALVNDGVVTMPDEGHKLRIAYNIALERGWISKRDGRVLASGWNAAAAFLKR